MTLVIDLPQTIEDRITEEAERAGVSPADLVAEVVRRNFGASGNTLDADEQKRHNASTIALLQSWLAKAERPRPAAEDIEAEEDLAELKRNLNAPRRESGERLHFPDAEEKP